MDQSVEKLTTPESKSQPALLPDKFRTNNLYRWSVLLIAALIILIILEIGSLAFNWTWTGFKDSSLWDWLNLLILPVVLASVTAWFTVDQSLLGKIKQQHRWQVLGIAVLVAAVLVLVVLAFGSYVVSWSWTGFGGNKLWDWLNFLVLPVVVTSMTIWLTVNQRLVRHKNSRGQRRWRTLWIVLIVIVSVALLVTVVGGYAFNWTWTGFIDNRLWDWLRLILTPIILPIVTVWLTTHPNQPAVESVESQGV